jgi:hypothetical protein
MSQRTNDNRGRPAAPALFEKWADSFIICPLYLVSTKVNVERHDGQELVV